MMQEMTIYLYGQDWLELKRLELTCGVDIGSVIRGAVHDTLECNRAIPWIATPALEWLINAVDRAWDVYEWGSGGSTRWFHERCRSITSVDHNREWESWRYKVNIIEPTKVTRATTPDDPDGYRSADDDLDYSAYVTFIDNVPALDGMLSVDGMAQYDMIMIDGRARPSCIKHSLPHVKQYLMLDNATREYYRRAISLIPSEWELTKFRGLDSHGHCEMTDTWVWERK